MGRPPLGHPYVNGPYKHRARYRLRIYTGARSPRGKRDCRYEYFLDEEEAKRFKREFERQVAAAGRSVGDAVTEFLAWKSRKGNKARSIETDRHRLAAILDLAMPVASLSAARAQALYDELVDTPVRGGQRKMAADTHQACLVQATALGRFCVDKGWLRANPFGKVEPVGRKSRGKEQLRLDEARAFYAHCLKVWTERKDATAIAAVLPFILDLRASEVAELVARDVDDRGRILWIAEGEDARGAELGKTAAARRRLKIPPALQPVLLELAAGARAAGGEERLFALLSGRPANRHRVADWAEIHMRRAIGRRVTTHGLRGTHATLATEAGTSPVQLALSMGHESPTMTERHYIDGGARRDAETERLMDALREDES